MRKILIADDEEGMRIALSEALMRAGFELTCCRDGLEAVQALSRGSYSMVITDIKMPKLDGLGVLREVKKIAPDTPVVMITAYGTVDSAVEAMKEGACDYLLKPFSFENLIEIVKNGFAQADMLNDKQPPVAGRGAGKTTGRAPLRDILTNDPEMLRILNMARGIASSTSTVLIYGESGTGKELIARFVHENSPRASKPFVAVNCAAIPDNLLESELFGHEKGSFTGAAFRKFGKFELAQGGTILLDEIGEMSITLQAKLLRVLQEFEIDRIGGKEPVPIDVRVISTTNMDLKKSVADNTFREDLYYRLNVIPLKLPPLRERSGDVELLAQHFLHVLAEKNGKHVKHISREAMQEILHRSWPGNVRELLNTIERAVLLCSGDVITPGDLILDEMREPAVSYDDMPTTTIEEMERRLISKTLDVTNGNRTHAAKSLGISIRTLRNKLKEYKVKNFAVEGV
jgi:two-component system response regulator FlrC